MKENFDVKDYEDWEERAAILEYDGGLEWNEARTAGAENGVRQIGVPEPKSERLGKDWIG